MRLGYTHDPIINPSLAVVEHPLLLSVYLMNPDLALASKIDAVETIFTRLR